MNNLQKAQDNVLELAEKLMRIASVLDDRDLRERARQIRDRVALPMAKVLERVEGATVIDKVKNIGVSRQAYYAWIYGRARPNAKQSLRLAQLTGFDPEVIRGRKLSMTASARASRASRSRKRNRDNLPA